MIQQEQSEIYRNKNYVRVPHLVGYGDDSGWAKYWSASCASGCATSCTAPKFELTLEGTSDWSGSLPLVVNADSPTPMGRGEGRCVWEYCDFFVTCPKLTPVTYNHASIIIMSVHSCKGVARVPTMKCWKFCSKEFERIQFSEFFPSSPDSWIFWNSPRDSRQQWRFPHGVSGLAAKMIGHYSRGGSACARPWSYQGNGCFAEGPHFQNWASHRTMIFCRVCPTLHIFWVVRNIPI